ncbi:MAG: SUMF1/EgtB/PvdO family nonheme iron enzyme, partial [Cyanobacteria bacterium P01_F01_bin.150]
VTPVNFFNIANPWGLCDMHGNVGEWCLDHWKYNYFGAPVDGTAWIDERFNEERIVRGARYYDPLKTTSDSRRKTEYYNDEGFRVVVPFPKLHASPDVHPQNQDAILGGHPPSPILKTLSRTAGIQTKHIRVDIGENDPLIMVHIPAGEFLMGFKEYKIARYESLGGPQHMVKMPTFWISKYPITRSQWTALALSGQVDMPLPTNPSQPVRKLQDDIPGTYNPIYVKRDYYSVDHVSWDEAIEFCKRLSQHTGQDYRLPSEAEWQYACNPLEKNPWVSQCSPNRFGICNLHSGSCIWEWCADYWHKNHIGGPTDGSAWTRGGDSDLRVIRGGNGNGLSTTIETMRFVARSHHSPDKNDKFIGFRVVLASR